MKSLLFTSLCMGLACASPRVSADDAPSGVYQVGVSRVEITPDYPIRLNGFGFRREESKGVSQSIFARGLAVSTTGNEAPLVLLAIDSLGVRVDMVDEVARRLHESHQIPRENVALTFSHSHCTPKVNGACDNIFSTPIPAEHQQHIDRYTEELTELLTRSAREAIDSRAPSRLSWGEGKVGFAKNRRTPGGPVDHSLPVLVVRDAGSDRIRAIYVSYACHAVVLSFDQISGDWPGYAAEMIERQNPDAIALVSIGAGSDSNPLSGVVGDKVEVAEGYGLQIADEVARLLKTDLSTVTGPVHATLGRIDLPLNELPTREQFEEIAEQENQFGYNARTQLARLDRGEELISKIEYPVQTWSFGDSLCMVFLAGEVCVDYSLRLKEELDRSRLWLNAYSNDFCSYIPSERLAKEGRYGGGSETPYFALPTTLKAGLEQLIVDEVHRQAPDAFEPGAGTNGIPPKSPDDSLNCLQTHDNLKVELVAAEPLVSDPVAIDFGVDGCLWVAEMNDYGHGVYEQFPQTGRIRRLQDVDGDGRFDEATTFVDGLRFPTDVKVWRDGLLICDAPDILFARDTDGDGQADATDVLFTGFSIINAQARVNSLRFGLDNWLYGAAGIFGGQIRSLKNGETIDVGSRDFRFDPDSGAIEAATGNTQQGRDRNDWGDWFGCSSGSLLKYFPTVARYTQRNPYVTPPPTVAGIADAAALKLFPPDSLVTFELSGAPGAATAACGLGIYRDQDLGPEFSGNAFTCEPVHQLVHRIVLEPDGVGYAGRRATDEVSSEFLTSTDNWFRPVQARTGPDGGLWVVDMYRYVIEHSRWIPQDALQQLDVYAGRGRGRIYRVVRGHKPAGPLPKLNSLKTSDLVARLDSSNGAVRDLAHQMLIWEGDENVVEQLQDFAARATTPQGTIHALCALQHLEGLTVRILQEALEADHPEVIRQAVRLGEAQLTESDELTENIVALAQHDSPRVRQQVAWSLGETADARAAAALAGLLSRRQPAEIQNAALSSINPANVNPVFERYSALPNAEQVDGLRTELASLAVRIGDPSGVSAVLAVVTPDASDLNEMRALEIASILNAADRRAVETPLHVPAEVRKPLGKLLQWAHTALADRDRSDDELRAALSLWGRRAGPLTRQVLDEQRASAQQLPGVVQNMSELVSPRYPAELQRLAIGALGRTGHASVGNLLAKRLPTVGVAAADAIADTLLSRSEWTQALLDEAEAGTLRLDTVSIDRQQRLLSHRDQSVQTRSRRLLNTASTSSRSEVVASHEEVLSLASDVSHGRDVFRKRCSTCHRLEDHGTAVGPDLLALTNRDPKWLLGTILDPNREVDARYTSWTALTDDGRTATGLLAEESATSIRLKEAEGKEHILLRNEIDQLISSGRSLMPEGLERDMSPQDLADVIAYVGKTTGPAGNAPVTPAETPLPRYAPQIAPFLLDDSVSTERRQQAIDQRPGMGPAIVGLLVADLPPGDLKEEYRRIPWIWRVSLAVGKRNDGGEIGDLLGVALPEEGQPLRDWQAVVIGGGIINGLTQIGKWPDERIAEILQSAPGTAPRWERTLKLAAQMADNKDVKSGTRYDALRMIALQGWETAGPQLLRYLSEKTPDELQMGAVSGLCDIRSPEMIEPLVVAYPRLSKRNRLLAEEGLIRTPERAHALLDAIASGRIDPDLLDGTGLREHAEPGIRQRASSMFQKKQPSNSNE